METASEAAPYTKRKVISLDEYRSRNNNKVETASTSDRKPKRKHRSGKDRRLRKEIDNLKRILGSCKKKKDETNITRELDAARKKRKEKSDRPSNAKHDLKHGNINK